MKQNDEKSLHRAVAKLLNYKRIVYIHSRTDQRTTQAKGVPDFIFAVKPPQFAVDGVLCGSDMTACAWELKTAKGKLRPEQIAMHWKMQKLPNAWNVKVIRTIDEAIQELEAMGL